MRVLYFTLAIIFSDQLTKLIIKGIDIPLLGIHHVGLPYGTSISIIGDFLRLTYIENPGMAFGIDLGGKLFFSLFSVAASIGIIIYLYKVREENLPFRISLAMILGGAVGNLIDRVFYGFLFAGKSFFNGSVVDFIDVDFFNVNIFGYHMNRWPVFNIADTSVTCGVILMLFVHRKIVSEENPSQQLAAVADDGKIVPQETSSEQAQSNQTQS
ncbi:MAG: signal peptidase II [Ignavibacteriales bacterium]|nr:signal peptidase II [Ignavibacteriales bacterium]